MADGESALGRIAGILRMSAVCGGYAVFCRSCRARSAMPQLQLPIFPDRVTYITNHLAFRRQDGEVTYFNGHMPVFSRAETDVAAFSTVDELKAQRKATQRHIAYQDLPADARFDRLSTQSKNVVDTIKMLAYRAETAMAQILRQTMSRHDDARSLLRAVYFAPRSMPPRHNFRELNCV